MKSKAENQSGTSHRRRDVTAAVIVAEPAAPDANLPGDRHSFALVSGAGDTHNSYFSVNDSGQLVLAQPPAGSDGTAQQLAHDRLLHHVDR